jgi:uncharacterized Zn finger protein
MSYEDASGRDGLDDPIPHGYSWSQLTPEEEAEELLRQWDREWAAEHYCLPNCPECGSVTVNGKCVTPSRH